MQRSIIWKSAALAMVAALSLSGCAAGAAPEEEQIELSYLVFNSPNLGPEIWEAAVDRYEETHPNVTVKIVTAPDTDITAYAQQLAGSGQLPDVVTSVDATQFVEAGQLLPFEESELEPWVEPMAGAIDGVQYQLPRSTQVIPFMYYNKSAFEAAGIDEAPTTWDEFIAACEKLKAAGITPLKVSGSDADILFSLFMLNIITTDVVAENPDWVKQVQTGDVAFTDDNFVAALQKYKDFVDAGFINADAAGLTYEQGQQSFIDGDAGMYAMGSWFASAADGSSDPENFGVFALPTESGDIGIPASTGGGNVVSAATKYPEEAKEFAIAIDTDIEFITASIKADGIYPNLKDFPEVEGLGAVFTESLALATASKQLPGFGTARGDDALPAATGDVVSAQGKAIFTGQSSAADAAKAMQDSLAQ